jgi:putative FmdB family regulatory protein
MPTYDYRCESCGHRLEHFQSADSPKIVDCPKCSKPTLVRLIGGGCGLHFKGSGFYETDYKKKR